MSETVQTTLDGWINPPSRRSELKAKDRAVLAKTDAKKREIGWELTEDEANTLCGKQCHYCFCKNVSCGIDRIDSDLNYSDENTVPCCTRCNFLKHTLPTYDFITHCYAIAKRHRGYISPLEKELKLRHTRQTDSRYRDVWHMHSKYMSKAKEREIEWRLTFSDVYQKSKEPCFYCDKPRAMGIDRICSRGVYEIENAKGEPSVVACCRLCNYAKGVLSIKEFVDQCVRIADHYLKTHGVPEKNGWIKRRVKETRESCMVLEDFSIERGFKDEQRSASREVRKRWWNQ